MTDLKVRIEQQFKHGHTDGKVDRTQTPRYKNMSDEFVSKSKKEKKNKSSKKMVKMKQTPDSDIESTNLDQSTYLPDTETVTMRKNKSIDNLPAEFGGNLVEKPKRIRKTDLQKQKDTKTRPKEAKIKKKIEDAKIMAHLAAQESAASKAKEKTKLIPINESAIKTTHTQSKDASLVGVRKEKTNKGQTGRISGKNSKSSPDDKPEKKTKLQQKHDNIVTRFYTALVVEKDGTYICVPSGKTFKTEKGARNQLISLLPLVVEAFAKNNN